MHGNNSFTFVCLFISFLWKRNFELCFTISLHRLVNYPLICFLELERLKYLQESLSECKHSLFDYQEKYSKCTACVFPPLTYSSLSHLPSLHLFKSPFLLFPALKETKKQLKNREELYESSRNKVLELQEKIINSQQGLSFSFILIEYFWRKVVRFRGECAFST